MNELQWDKLLKIKTTGRDDSRSDTYHYPYEPTPYSVLERLANSGYLKKSQTVVDYGCGKGRVGFFLRYQVGCAVVGVEYDERIHSQAMKNLESSHSKNRVEFLCVNAEEYQPDGADSFYFFNPFSVEILKSVVKQILYSYYHDPRRMTLFFYYPNDDYLAYLMSVDELMFVDEIDCRDLFDGNEREKILIFEIGIYE